MTYYYVETGRGTDYIITRMVTKEEFENPELWYNYPGDEHYKKMKVVASSRPGFIPSRSSAWIVIRNEPGFKKHSRKISVSDFPLYISSSTWKSLEFEQVLKGGCK